MVLSLRRSADGVSFDNVENALRVPVLSLRSARYSLCAPRGIVSALQRYSVSDIITNIKKRWNCCSFIAIKNVSLQHQTKKLLLLL